MTGRGLSRARTAMLGAFILCLGQVGYAAGQAAPAREADASAEVRHICWIDRVIRDGAGVRVFFASAAPVAPAPNGTYAALGATLMPATSGHDGCIVTVERVDGRIGVRAQAHLFLPSIMREPDVRTEWIAAASAR